MSFIDGVSRENYEALKAARDQVPVLRARIRELEEQVVAIQRESVLARGWWIVEDTITFPGKVYIGPYENRMQAIMYAQGIPEDVTVRETSYIFQM